jgi:4-hydroxy-2-oxoheptanedioate aldolase
MRQGQIPLLLKCNLSEPRVMEIAGLSGVDGVWLCNEHVPNDWIGLENQIRAAKLHDIDTIVRVSRGSYSDYIKPFEADATGIMVPHVADVDQARQIIDWVRFQPLGRRPMDGGNSDGQFCFLGVKDYMHHSNTERFVILQIESPEALENVEKIAALPGFDMLLFGPGDFSHRLGKPGEVNAPEVVAARKRVAAAAKKHGKFCMSAGLYAPLADLVAEGHGLFSVGADVVAIANYTKERVQMVRGQIAGLPAEIRPKSQSPYA